MGVADCGSTEAAEATKVSAAKAMQPKPAEGIGLDEKAEAAGAEEVEEENLRSVLHKAREAPRPRALNEVLGVELQPCRGAATGGCGSILEGGERRGVEWGGGGGARVHAAHFSLEDWHQIKRGSSDIKPSEFEFLLSFSMEQSERH